MQICDDRVPDTGNYFLQLFSSTTSALNELVKQFYERFNAGH